MKKYPITIKPFGEHAVLIEWPTNVDDLILEDILQFHKTLQHRLDKSWEFVPAYNSLALISKSIIDFKKFSTQLFDDYQRLDDVKKSERFIWTIPVCYDANFGPDLAAVASNLKMSIDELIANHSSNEYTVFGIGFLPGFMYLGGLPKTLETARKKVPRLKVAKGSVGLAGRQTGIYPQDSPGGWNIIGNCPIPIFDVHADDPCYVNVGDRIKFEAITKAAYDLHKIEAEVGIYKPIKRLMDA